MKNKTVRVIIILVGLLILNIEAAHAGITHKFKVLIASEFSGFQFFYVVGACLTLALLSYIVFTPAFKENSKAAALAGNYFMGFNRNNYKDKRVKIKKIKSILKNSESFN